MKRVIICVVCLLCVSFMQVAYATPDNFVFEDTVSGVEDIGKEYEFNEGPQIVSPPVNEPTTSGVYSNSDLVRSRENITRESLMEEAESIKERNREYVQGTENTSVLLPPEAQVDDEGIDFKKIGDYASIGALLIIVVYVTVRWVIEFIRGLHDPLRKWTK